VYLPRQPRNQSERLHTRCLTRRATGWHPCHGRAGLLELPLKVVVVELDFEDDVGSASSSTWNAVTILEIPARTAPRG
jgi:hypothetical protein